MNAYTIHGILIRHPSSRFIDVLREENVYLYFTIYGTLRHVYEYPVNPTLAQRSVFWTNKRKSHLVTRIDGVIALISRSFESVRCLFRAYERVHYSVLRVSSFGILTQRRCIVAPITLGQRSTSNAAFSFRGAFYIFRIMYWRGLIPQQI